MRADASLDNTHKWGRGMGVREAAREKRCAGGEAKACNGSLRPRLTPFTTPLFPISWTHQAAAERKEAVKHDLMVGNCGSR